MKKKIMENINGGVQFVGIFTIVTVFLVTIFALCVGRRCRNSKEKKKKRRLWICSCHDDECDTDKAANATCDMTNTADVADDMTNTVDDAENIARTQEN